jgi:hypothetical protein
VGALTAEQAVVDSVARASSICTGPGNDCRTAAGAIPTAAVAADATATAIAASVSATA